MTLFDFNLEAYIHFADGQVGTLIGLVVGPLPHQVTDLIIKKGYLMTSEARLVPLSNVDNALIESVRLTISSDEFDRYPRYDGVEQETPAAGLEVPASPPIYTYYGPPEAATTLVKQNVYSGILAGQTALGYGVPAINDDGKFGTLIRVMIESEPQEITNLVIQRGLLLPEQIVVPISLVENIQDDGISVITTNGILKQLPRYSPSV